MGIFMLDSVLNLKGCAFSDLLTLEGLRKLDQLFLSFLKSKDSVLHGQLLHYRQGCTLSAQEISTFLIDASIYLEHFLADTFSIQSAVHHLKADNQALAPIFAFKKFFVLREGRRALRQAKDIPSFATLDQWLTKELIAAGLEGEDRELKVAQWGSSLLEDASAHQDKIDLLILWCVSAMTTAAGQRAVQGWVSFHIPARLNYENLVHVQPLKDDAVGRFEGERVDRRHRDGFALTDPRPGLRDTMDQVYYCVYCHEKEGDFCSKGFPVKKGDQEQGLKINPLGEPLTGCPLDEKISEMHVLKKQGYVIASLAVVMVDNPMCPATGHRICNDCMKACIYQKQEPVNIPAIETGILSEVLALPWGVEIYDLLTRWNPLRQTQYLPKPYSGKKVLIMGMGPAGFTLAHYLLMEGFAVVGVDGLKIEPLPNDFFANPIQDYHTLEEQLDHRVMSGFGGVAEYGITVRWDKNFLKLIYLSLMRRPYFQVLGSIRFGGTLTVSDAWLLGFDHLSIAVGAGLPRELPISHSLATGMRQANDFLMALQLTGAAKASSLTNLQVRLPAVVIGGGLTGIDTATEVQAYYITQVEKILHRYTHLVNCFSETVVRGHFSEAALFILDEFLAHGMQVRQERSRAKATQDTPNLRALIQGWGGVTIVYRRTMQASPAYKRNHEEVMKAFQEGIFYAEGLEPTAARVDEHGHIHALVCRSRVMDETGVWVISSEEQCLPARAIFVATGAKPNIAYEYEHRGTFLREADHYQRFSLQSDRWKAEFSQGHCKIKDFGPFTSYTDADEHRITFLGDTHPIFHGSVVKAIASAKRTYPHIVHAVVGDALESPRGDEAEYTDFHKQIKTLLSAHVVQVKRHAPHIVECEIRAPMAAKNFSAGQFYRLQNYERYAACFDETSLQTEAMALVGARQSHDPDVLSFIVLERGVSSRLIATFKPGDPVSLMGPTGSAHKLWFEGKKWVMLLGGSMAAAHCRSLGPALRQSGHRVFYMALMKTTEELFYQDELEAGTDRILWVTESGASVRPRRPQDGSSKGDFVIALSEYAQRGGLVDGSVETLLHHIDHVHIIGSSDLIRRFQQARKSVLRGYFNPKAEFTAAVYGPMQCMMKGVCAQCLQWQLDPKTGERTKAVYACSWQQQPMDIIDIDNIDERLRQNEVQEILSNLWLDYLFKTQKVEHV